jgi:hypothetical protein
MPLLIDPHRHSGSSESLLEERQTLRICVSKIGKTEASVAGVLNRCLVA